MEISVNHFYTNAGRNQECPLSVQLFTIVLDDVMSEVCSKRKKNNIGLSCPTEGFELSG